MPYYRYRCNRCRTTSPRAPSRDVMRAERDSHRDRFHGGHAPDGEEYLREGFDWVSFSNPLAILILLAIANFLWTHR